MKDKHLNVLSFFAGLGTGGFPLVQTIHMLTSGESLSGLSTASYTLILVNFLWAMLIATQFRGALGLWLWNGAGTVASILVLANLSTTAALIVLLTALVVAITLAFGFTDFAKKVVSGVYREPVSWIAGALACIMLVPQIWYTATTGDVSGVSFTANVFLAAGTLLWAWYTRLQGGFAFMVVNLAVCACAIFLLVLLGIHG